MFAQAINDYCDYKCKGKDCLNKCGISDILPCAIDWLMWRHDMKQKGALLE